MQAMIHYGSTNFACGPSFLQQGHLVKLFAEGVDNMDLVFSVDAMAKNPTPIAQSHKTELKAL